MENLFKKLIENKKTLASVESFTGGLFASEIISISGASNFFKGSLVCYNNEIKEKLGVNTSNGVINANVAKEMSLKGKEFFNVDYCISFTGNAGPNVMENKKIGLVFISINDIVFELEIKENERNKIRKAAVEFAISKLNDIISNNILK